uniref:Putative product n=1 Tax=Xenopsylla cheopis TaxID=163159 RepID=A0A6M2DZB0_XENCH
MILFVFLYFLHSSIFFSIFCVTHGFLADFSNFPTLCSNVARNISYFFPFFIGVIFITISLLFSVYEILSPFAF